MGRRERESDGERERERERERETDREREREGGRERGERERDRGGRSLEDRQAQGEKKSTCIRTLLTCVNIEAVTFCEWHPSLPAA